MSFRLVAVGLVCLLVFSTGSAVARIHLSVGLGTSFGHYHPHYYGHDYPLHRWYGGYYSPWWGHSYWPGPFCSPGSSFWIYSSYPIVLSPPVRVKAPAENPKPEPQPQFSQRMREEQSELVKILKVGDTPTSDRFGNPGSAY